MSLKDIVDQTNIRLSRSMKLKRHVDRSHPFREKEIKCLYCKTPFETQELLELHRNPQLNRLDSNVPLCPKLPPREKSICNQCGKAVGGGHMRSHLALAHGVDRDKVYRFKCTDCDKAFPSPAKLKRHLFINHLQQNEANSQCRLCGRQFSTNTYLKKHMLTHKEPSIQCPRCDKFFKQRKNVIAHLRGEVCIVGFNR